MYAALVDSAHYTFQASGSLWQDALVMQDLQTESLWSQVSGECISGKMEDRQLVQFPAIHTTFEEFSHLYPHGVVLTKPARGLEGSRYSEYFRDRSRLGVFGRVNNFELLDGKDPVYGLRLDGRQIAISRRYLADNGYATVENGSRPAVVTLDKRTATVAAFLLPEPAADSLHVLTYDRQRCRLLLPDSSAIWDSRTGAAIAGSIGNLKHVPVISAFWFAWISFFPGTDLIK